MSFSKIKEIANQSDYRDVNLYIFKKKSGNRDPLVHNIGIDKNTKNKLREHILSTINRISIDNEIVEYNPIITRKDTIEKAIKSDFPDLNEYVSLIINSGETCERTDNRNDFYCIDININSENRFLSFNKIDDLKNLKKLLLGVIKDEFRQIPIDEKIISLGTGISFFVHNEEVFIYNKGVFKQIINIEKLIIEDAKKILVSINEGRIISNFSDFEVAVLERKRARNISAKASRKNVVAEVVREVNKIKEAAEKLFTAGKIDNKIVFEDDKIKYIDGNERDILILLNDLGYQTLILNNTDTNE